MTDHINDKESGERPSWDDYFMEVESGVEGQARWAMYVAYVVLLIC